MTDTWRPSPEAIRRQAGEKDEKDCDFAIRALELAVKHHGVDDVVSRNRAVTDTAEWFYRWIKSEEEPAQIWEQPEDWQE